MIRNKVSIQQATKKDIEIIQQIAYKTWPIAYAEILSTEQLKYMLDSFYNIGALESQIESDHIFLIAEDEKIKYGFASFSNLDNPSIYKLHKLYVLPNSQQSGIGKKLLLEVIERIKILNGKTLLLNVNRNNKAIEFYKHFGFTITDIDDIDIGNGYCMNDYIMCKNI